MPTFTNDDIVNHARSKGYLDANGAIKNDEAVLRAIWSEAHANNVSSDQLDQAFKLRSGRSAEVAQMLGLGALNGAGVTPAPAPAPTPGPAPAPAPTPGAPAPAPATAPAPSPSNPAAPTAAPGTTTTPTDMSNLSSMIASIVAGVRGATPAAPAAPTQPPAFQPTQAQLDGIDSGKRIGGLLEGPTARQAERQAMERANSRGLLNSSMAVEGAQEAMIANAAEIAAGDANRFLSLTETGINRDTALDSLFARAGFDERNLQLRAANDLTSDAVNFGLKDAANVRDKNADWERELQTFGLNTTRDREDTATTRAYNDRVRSEGWGREDMVSERDWLRDRQTRTEDWARDDRLRDEDWDRQDENIAQGVRAAYTTQLTGLRDAYNNEVAAVENSDLPPEVKAARATEIKGRYQALVNITNSIFKSMPQWKTEWTQLQLT